MKKIVLLCNQGMSTSALVAKMREVIKRNNLDYVVNGPILLIVRKLRLLMQM